MKKLILSLFIICSLQSIAQTYHHGLGFNISLNSYRFKYTDASNFTTDNSQLNLVPSIVYKASVGFLVKTNMYFAASAYPAIGGAYKSNYNTQSGQTKSTYIAFDLPILAEFYFGEIDDNAFHFGAGYDFNGFKQNGYGRNMHGPQLSFGGQFFLRERFYHLRFFYTKGLNKTKDIPTGVTVNEDRSTFFGGSLIYMFGQ